MSRVAIVGSCITRDLWPVRGDALKDVLYISRTSLPSLFAPPVRGFRPAPKPPNDLHAHQHRSLCADLQKTALATLIAFRPSHIIFDFIDERFDLLATAGTIITGSWELDASGYRQGRALRGARTIPRLSAACDRLWDQAAGEMAAFIRATPLREARLILHSARWADRSRRPGGRPRPLRHVEVLPGQPAEIAAHNALLARYESRFAELMPPMARIEAPRHRVADEAHRWGLSPFHYAPAYYSSILEQLRELGVPQPVSEALAAPSAPAA